MSAIHPLSHAPVIKVPTEIKPPVKQAGPQIETAKPPKPTTTTTGVNKTV
jgi:hypothetical protein